MQEENSDNTAVAASAAFSVREEASNEEMETQNGNRKTGNGYEALDPREVEEARLRAQRPSEYVKLHGDRVEDLYSLPKKKR